MYVELRRDWWKMTTATSPRECFCESYFYDERVKEEKHFADEWSEQRVFFKSREEIPI